MHPTPCIHFAPCTLHPCTLHPAPCTPAPCTLHSAPGLVSFLLPVLVCIPLVGFLADTDVPGLDFLQKNYLLLHKVIRDTLMSHEWTMDKHEEIMEQIDTNFRHMVLAATIYSGKATC